MNNVAVEDALDPEIAFAADVMKRGAFTRYPLGVAACSASVGTGRDVGVFEYSETFKSSESFDWTANCNESFDWTAN